MKSIISIMLLLFINPGQPLSYPIYGTKRYQRTSSSSSLMPSSQTYSYPLNSYYDSQPILSSSSSSSSTGSSTGSNLLSSYGSLPFSIGNYPNNNNNNGYISDASSNYYYPHHDYHMYGMPTYHGEYKPKPYYYAPAPRYSYFDDREITSNPLDDLHEEMLHENERIQQRQVLQDQPSAYFGKESWYQTGPSRQDELTNNFLRNLIAYNKQLEQQKQERQLTEQDIDDDYMQRDQYAVYNSEPDNYNDYPENGDYEYDSEPAAIVEPTNQLERKKFEKIQANQEQQFLQEQKQRQQYQNKINEVDDEDVRQLKNLAKYSKQKETNSHIVPQEEESYRLVKSKLPSVYNYDTPSYSQTKPLKSDNSANSILKTNTNVDYKSDHKFIEPVETEPIEDSDEWYTPQQSSNANLEKSSYSSVPQYDEPEEYYEDDGAWISWDRKRNNDRTIFDFDQKFKLSPKRIDLIKAFNDRKPQNLKLINLKSTISSTTSTTSTATKDSAPKTKSANKKFQTTSTNIATSTIVPVLNNNKLVGQKEVVLPRPAGVSQHIFTAPILSMINGESKPLLQQQQQQITSDSSNKLQHTNSKLQKQSNRSSDAIYKTIKQLISMENHLDQDSKKHKRFVTNEESLVNELDKLKRRTTT